MPELHQNDIADPGPSRRADSELKPRLTVALVLIIGLALVTSAVQVLVRYEQKSHQDHFHALAQGPIQDIRRRAYSNLEMLVSVAQFYASSQSVDFRRCVTGPLARYPEVLRISWIPRITSTERENFERRVGSSISTVATDQPSPAPEAPEYFPVEIVEPDLAEERGKNLASDPVTMAAMSKAAALGRPVVTPLRLHNPGSNEICQFFMPIYNTTNAPADLEQRRRALHGFVSIILSPRGLVRNALSFEHLQGFQLQLLDRSAPPEAQLLSADTLDVSRSAQPWTNLTSMPIHSSESFDLGGRQWAIVCRPTAAMRWPANWLPWTVLIGGLLIVGLSAGYLYQLLTRTSKIERTVAVRTSELAAANALLQAEIVERKKTQSAISSSEARLQAILDNSSAVIYLKDFQGRYLLVNREFERLFKVKRHEVQAKTDLDLFPKEMAEKFRQNDQRALQAESALEFEEVAPVDGKLHTYISIKFPLREPQGPIQGVCGISTDITERVGAEQALKDGEALYHSLVECLPLNVVRKDRQGRVTFANERFCRTLGQSQTELLGKTDFDLFPANLADKYVADDHRVLETGQVFEDVEEHHTPEGEDLYMHVLKSPVYDARREVVGIQVIFWDVTDKHQAERALQRTMADLSRSNQELEQFAYVASHDLQEPLRMIASYTQLLARRYKNKLDPEAEEFIAYAVDGAVRMQKLINDLLTYSRVGTRGKAFSLASAEEVLKTVLANLKIAIEEAHAEITHDPLPSVLADSTQITQLLQNLIGNALKFCGEKSPRIHIGAQLQGQEWVFEVRDNGIGIEKQYFERIFIIFQRLHTPQEYPGTGIGLAICKKIVERHGGRIWVESQTGQGTTFFFTLPSLPKPSNPAPP